MEMVEKEGDQMESKTSKERWIYTIAELYGVSVGDIQFMLNKCITMYGNRLDFEHLKKYVRAILRKIVPIRYFQFTGKVFKDGWRNIYLPEIPIWFQHYNTNLDKCVISESRSVYDDFGECVHVRGYIYFKNSRKRTCIEDDYMVDIRPFGIMSVPKSVFEDCYEKDEIALYKYCQDQYDLGMDW